MNISKMKMRQKLDGRGRIYSFEDAIRGNVYFMRTSPEQGMRWREDLVPTDWTGEDTEPNFRDGTLPPYLIENKSKRVRVCMPFKDANLLSRFIKLANSPTPDAIEKFANRYGFLGHPVTLRNPEKQVNALLPGESLAYWQSEVEIFAELWKRWQSVLWQDEHALKEYVKWTDDGGFIRLEISNGVYKRFMTVRQFDEDIGEIKDAVYSKIVVGDVVTTMRVYIEEGINNRLQGHVHPVVFHFVDTNLHMAPDCLLSGLYLLFAFEIVGERLKKNPHKACKGCDNHFSPSRPNQLYCDKNCKARTNRRLQRARLKKELSRKKKSPKAK